MYYLFLTKKSDLKNYKQKLFETKDRIDQGKTPVFNEMACAKTNLIECFPMNLIAGIFSVIGAIFIAKIEINDLLKIAVVMIINSLCWNIANFIFTVLKHKLRLRLLRKLGLYPSDENIAAMESLEYQSV